MASPRLRFLSQFSACDISDALFKLKINGSGFLADLRHFPPVGITPDRIPLLPKIAAPASTVLFVPKDSNPSDQPELYQHVLEPNIPPSQHYVDYTRQDTFVVMSQPAGQTCAVLGGIMASRMKKCGARGIVVGGRCRDARELRELHLPIWAENTSTVGAGAETKVWATNVPVTVKGILIHPGDIIFSDPMEGIVVIPKDKIDAVIDLVPKLVKADEKVKADVEGGMTVKEAFAKHRSNL